MNQQQQGLLRKVGVNKIAGTEEVGCQSMTDFNVLNLVFCVSDTQ